MTTTAGIWIAAAAIIAASYGAWLVKPSIDKKLKPTDDRTDDIEDLAMTRSDNSHSIVLNTAEAETTSMSIKDGEPDPDNAISGPEKPSMPDVLNMVEAEVDSMSIKDGEPDPNEDFFDEDPAEEEAEAIQEQLMKDTYEKPKAKSKIHASAKHYNGNQEIRDFEERHKSKKRGRPRKTKITTD
jgi:hypothetical protein